MTENSILRKKRTKIDWSRHEVTVIKYGDDVLVHKFKRPNTISQSVTFINAFGVLTVTGDYGNWVFCREFHPSSDGSVSEHYWCEKARISSTQRVSDFCPDSTREKIEKLISEQDMDDPLRAEEIEYLNDLLSNIDDGYERYMVYAYDNQVGRFDFESIPCVKKLDPWLEAIFDAFDEICLRLETDKS